MPPIEEDCLLFQAAVMQNNKSFADFLMGAEATTAWKIKKQQLSNMSRQASCRKHGISYNTLQHRQKRIKECSQSSSVEKIFLEIPEESSNIQISIPGIKLSLSDHFEKQALIRLLNLLD